MPSAGRVVAGRNGDALVEIIGEAQRELAHHPAVGQVVKLGDRIAVIMSCAYGSGSCPGRIAGGRAIQGNRGYRIGDVPNLEGQVHPLDVVFLASGRVVTYIALCVGRQNAADVVNAVKTSLGRGHWRTPTGQTRLQNRGISAAAGQGILSFWEQQARLQFAYSTGSFRVNDNGSQ